MTEEQQQDQLMSETLCFLGKTLKRKGTNESGEWIVWKLNFQSGMQYDWTCSAFDKISDKGVQVAEMQEGQFYEVVYKINEFQTQYGTQKGKQAVLIKLSSAENSTEEGLKNKKNGSQGEKKEVSSPLAARDWVNFQKEYNTAMEGKPNKNSIHMLGAYIANKYQDVAGAIITLCKKNFE